MNFSRFDYWPLILATIVAIIVLLAGLSVGDGVVDSWTIASRWTARTGVIFFIITYSTSSLAQLWPNLLTRALLRQRRWFGLSFAVAHTFHLFALANFLAVLPQTPSPLGLGLFLLVYIPIYVMALTSFPWAYKALGKYWHWLHKVGIHIIWTAMVFVYVSKAFVDLGQRVPSIIFGCVAIFALGLRIVAWFKKRSKNSPENIFSKNST